MVVVFVEFLMLRTPDGSYLGIGQVPAATYLLPYLSHLSLPMYLLYAPLHWKAEDWMQAAVACVSPEPVHPFLVGILRAFFRR